MKVNGRINVPDEVVADFCRRWKITQIEAFGSVLRDDFGPDSDIDLLVTFDPEARYGLFDLVRMESEMAEVVGRHVDLIDRRGVEESTNPFRRHSILTTARVVYRVA
jgi:predicted nucleotidyltransferase